jgi:hypothetical protein
MQKVYLFRLMPVCLGLIMLANSKHKEPKPEKKSTTADQEEARKPGLSTRRYYMPTQTTTSNTLLLHKNLKTGSVPYLGLELT